MSGWIGVDLDGTLARYESKQGIGHVGEPIVTMLQWVKTMLLMGEDVRIFTARVARYPEAVLQRQLIETWCEQHLGRKLPITCIKDFQMIALYDDRAIGVEKNTGRFIGEPHTRYET